MTLRQMVLLLLVAVLLSQALQRCVRQDRPYPHGSSQRRWHTGGDIALGLAAGLFLVGLISRARRAREAHGPLARLHQAEERRARRAVRPIHNAVPPVPEAQAPDDPDPAVEEAEP